MLVALTGCATGACWAYLATPFADHRATAERHAQDEGRRIGRCADVVVNEITRDGYNGPPVRRVVVTGAGGRQLSPDEVAGLCRASGY